VTGVGVARTGGPAAPRVGDALGEMLRDALAEQTGRGARPTLAARDPVAVTEVVERDDGFVSTLPASRYLAPPGEWPAIDHRALERARGRVLDVGAGGARASLALQARGYAVTALDVSPGAVEVARARGVRDAVCAPVTSYATTGRRYDTFLLLGNNLGLLGGPAGAPALLGALAALAAPGARVVANGTDPYATRDPVHLAYHERNRRAGRLGGQLRLRVRYRELASEWFDYLQCTVDELAGLLTGTAWRIDGVDEADAPRYLAVLALRGAGVTRAAGRDPR
jgi:SAM-dependent methyltransferase